MQSMPFTRPSFMATNIGRMRVVAEDLGVPVVAEVVVLVAAAPYIDLR